MDQKALWEPAWALGEWSYETTSKTTATPKDPIKNPKYPGVARVFRVRRR
jgi:hypothetical protein